MFQAGQEHCLLASSVALRLRVRQLIEARGSRSIDPFGQESDAGRALSFCLGPAFGHRSGAEPHTTEDREAISGSDRYVHNDS